MALAIVTPVKAAQQQYVPLQEDIEITKNIKDIQTAGYYSAAFTGVTIANAITNERDYVWNTNQKFSLITFS